MISSQVRAVTGESELDQLMTLYKNIATIRDVKETFFYIQVVANQLTASPLTYKYPFGQVFVDPNNNAVQLSSVAPYFAPLDTKRVFTIGNQVNSLLDLRIPKDKYVVQIQMIECLIEADPSNWIRQPNIYDESLANGTVKVGQSYDLEYLEQPDPTGTITPTDPVPRIDFASPILRPARKKTIPSPLYCRIRELNDQNEPYQWSVSNDGQVSLDKSHGIVTRFGDVHYSQLTLEFGHLLWRGKDEQYRQFGMSQVSRDPNPNGRDYLTWNPIELQGGQINRRSTVDISKYDDVEYLDYNREWSNSDSVTVQAPQANNVYTQPAARGTSYLVDTIEIKPSIDPPSNSEEVRLATLPIKTNQQCSSLVFRFSLKLIHMF